MSTNINNESLEAERQKLAAIDRMLIDQLAERHKILLRIAAIKANMQAPTEDKIQETKNLARNKLQAEKLGLSFEMVQEFSQWLAAWGRKIQDEHRSSKKGSNI